MEFSGCYVTSPKELVVSSAGPPTCCCKAEISSAMGCCPKPSVVVNEHSPMPSLMILDTSNFLGLDPLDILNF